MRHRQRQRSKELIPRRSAMNLFDKHRIFTTPIVHEEFQGIRITPNVYTTLGELDRFCNGNGRRSRERDCPWKASGQLYRKA